MFCHQTRAEIEDRQKRIKLRLRVTCVRVGQRHTLTWSSSFFWCWDCVCWSVSRLCFVVFVGLKSCFFCKGFSAADDAGEGQVTLEMVEDDLGASREASRTGGCALLIFDKTWALLSSPGWCIWRNAASCLICLCRKVLRCDTNHTCNSSTCPQAFLWFYKYNTFDFL